MGVWYTTRGRVKRSLDIAETARNDVLVDDAIEASSRTMDGHTPGAGFLRRRFYPEIRTSYHDWPNYQYSAPWRLWLGPHELISATTVTAGGTTIASTDYFLRPDSGPPYTHLEIDLASSAALKAGSTHQQAISILGSHGFRDDSEPAGTLAAAITTTTATTCNISDSSQIDVGHVIKVDSERFLVTNRSMLTTGQTLQTTALTASKADVTVNVTTGSSYAVGETILLDSERMLIVDIASNALTVKRAFDGSVLAAHNTGTTIYAPRTLTVTRGALGTTAATHSNGASITRLSIPGLVERFCRVQTLVFLGVESAGGADYAGEGETSRRVAGGGGLRQLREDVWTAYGRKVRKAAV